MLLRLLISTLCLSASAADLALLPNVIANRVADAQDAQVPDRVHLDGMVGARMQANDARLLGIDVDRLLEGYRKRPGRQSWDGEHIGKWLHAATLSWANTGDARLRTKLAQAVESLIACQEDDGYLGTYTADDRWTEWDVWAHKYNLIGLLTYIRYTGDRTPLSCCTRMADLLCATFGDRRLDIVDGWHQGMAPTSVLEPMVWIYQLTGDERYRDFCVYILRAWESDNGPRIVSRLIEGRGVREVGNAKAYEMLSCLNGLLEWHRVTGDVTFRHAAENAWQDIVANHRYITGASSVREFFIADGLPETDNVGETCVTVTWLQFNAHLLRLTGEARYAHEIERLLYNQLPGAQRPDGAAWGYYVQMRGVKPYSASLDGHCCLSSGPRGFALIPSFALTTDPEGVVVNMHEAGEARLRLTDGTSVRLAIAGRYPAGEQIVATIGLDAPRAFVVKMRIPDWCNASALQVGDANGPVSTDARGYVAIARTWGNGDRIILSLPATPRIVRGDRLQAGRIAVCCGPFVLATDTALQAGPGASLVGVDLAPLDVAAERAPAGHADWKWAQVFRIKTSHGTRLLAPFATAGADGASTYRVWLQTATVGDLLADGFDSRSRQGNLKGSILDGECVVTWNGEAADQDWYDVVLAAPRRIGRIEFRHGRNFPDGGWFDTTGGKPIVQARATADAPWTTVGTLDTYPTTSATNPGGLVADATFGCVFATPITAVGIRVSGKPATGYKPQQAFSSCAGLRAWEQ